MSNDKSSNVDEDMARKISWTEFRNAGMLWFINCILHAFGFAIAVQYDEVTNEITDVYPLRVKYRGFPETSNDKGYQRLTHYLKNNIDDLVEEVDENIVGEDNDEE